MTEATRGTRLRVALAGSVLCVLAACSSTPTPTAPPPSITPTGPALGPPAPSEAPVPSALEGTWREVGSDEKMALSGRGFKFFYQPGSFASGQVAVTGSTIVFFGSSDCAGTGTYRWAIRGDRVHFTATNHDPCPRSVNLDGKDWVLVRR